MTLELTGALTVREVSETRQAWLSALAEGQQAPVTLDVAGLTSIDTAGGQLLLALRRECQAQGRRLTITPDGGVLTEGLARLALKA